jgi:hypothetical protein
VSFRVEHNSSAVKPTQTGWALVFLGLKATQMLSFDGVRRGHPLRLRRTHQRSESFISYSTRSVRCRRLDVVDHDDFDGAFGRLQLEAELFLEGCEK